ncbi:MAG: heavy metal-binding domain-containing protein [Thermoanaerobaculia bacterium]
MISHNFITTGNELPGYRITRTLGIVRGITVRSRSIVGTIGAGLQSLFGGNMACGAGAGFASSAARVQLRKPSRSPRFESSRPPVAKRPPAAESHDANDVAQGVTEVLAYGTAVVVEQAR